MVVVEIKAIEKTSPIQEDQLLTYLKRLGRWIGLLLDFNVTLIKRGMKRLISSP